MVSPRCLNTYPKPGPRMPQPGGFGVLGFRVSGSRDLGQQMLYKSSLELQTSRNLLAIGWLGMQEWILIVVPIKPILVVF